MSLICRPKKTDEFEAMQWIGGNTEKFIEWLKTIHPGIKVEQRTGIDDFDVNSVEACIPTSKPYLCISDDVLEIPIYESDFIVHNKTKEYSYKLTEKEFNDEFEVVEIE